MRDPHVVWLRYRVEHKNESQRFENPQALIAETDAFKINLANGELKAEMKEHYATEGDARGAVERYLRSWEIDVGLRHGPATIIFLFQNAYLVDRNPPAPGEESVSGESILRCLPGLMMLTALPATFTSDHACYPPPPEKFLATPDVQSLWLRYQMYRDGREPLLSMAYFCLTLLEGTTGTKQGARHAVCDKYKIDRNVRDKLGDLTSKMGDPKEARKLDHEATRTPLSPSEKSWVEEVILALIRRKGEYDFDPSANFPPITIK